MDWNEQGPDETRQPNDARQLHGEQGPDGAQGFEMEEHSYPTMFGTAEVFDMETEDGSPIRALYVGGGFQSVTYTDQRRFQPAFAYCRAFDMLFDAVPEARNVLLLGGGAFSYPKHVLATRPNVHLDVVEVDPAIVRIAHDHFFWDEALQLYGADQQGRPRTREFAEDGLAFLEGCDPGSYDAIINDTFAGTVIDAPLLQAQALQRARECLTPQGVYLLNAVAEDEDGNQDEELLGQIRTALAETFSQVEETAVEDEEFTGAINHVFLARR